MTYETFEHTADVGLRMRAATLDALFAEAAQGLFSLICPDLKSIKLTETVSFSVAGEAHDLLLFDWLNELLYTYETRHLLLADFQVMINDAGLTATSRGETLDPARHVLDHEVKAITYHEFKVERSGDGWLAEVIVDI
jgi:SHS2 domain-containing protein